ncbi:ROA1 [Symbiodinium pilosum]|uniref:ROA1 protein n=1 Tax=Symbiodinium pilosum TaxID=2952 RepID=A0A812VR07_SYMPI|nr:ROA1 [Symbiodinium pilosum]
MPASFHPAEEDAVTLLAGQHMTRFDGANSKRGVEEVHCSVLERRAKAEANSDEATKVFEDQMPLADDDEAKELVTVDFLQKYIRFAKRLTPILSEEAREYVSEKYVEMRMRFQSGFADLQAENSERKPRLAVTTRTLEALIRLASAHAKLKLRKEFILVEDVEVAYRLMLAAREEEVPDVPAQAAPAQDDQDGFNLAEAETIKLKQSKEWVKAQLELERQMADAKDTRRAAQISEAPEQGEHEPHRASHRASVSSDLRLSAFSIDPAAFAQAEEELAEDEDPVQLEKPALETLDLELVQVVDESGKRLSKFALSAKDRPRFASDHNEGQQAEPGGDMYYFSHVLGNHKAVLDIRDAETALLLQKKRFFILKQKDIAFQLASRGNKDVGGKGEFTPEFLELVKHNFEAVRYSGRVPIQDLDLYFCTLVYGSKSAFTSIHALWDKFEVGEKGYMAKDEWFNLCTRVKTKLPQKVQGEIWDLLAWRSPLQMLKKDFVAGWHIHDLEVKDDLHLKSLMHVLKFDYYRMSVSGLQERMRIRLAEDADVLDLPQARGNDFLSIPFGEGERRFVH